MNALRRRLVAAGLALLAMTVFAAEPVRNLGVSHSDAPANGQRIALVIGNSAYKSSPLVNPVNDARAVSARLRSLGFTVIERQNLTFKQIGSTLREFRSRLTPGAVALFFYAGHGLQVKGANYLPVVDADIASEEDVSLQSLEIGKVLELMDEAKTRLNLVFLDACRNNPYARSFRSAADGLAKINAPSGTLISFATRPGSVAADGTGRNGLYTEKLLMAMNDTGQPIEQVLKRVVSNVKTSSSGRQEPWMEGSIEGDFCFGTCVGLPPSISAPSVASPDSAAIELAYWDSVKDSKTSGDYQAYLAQYPNGSFSNLATARINALQPASSSARPHDPGADASPTDERRAALERELADREDALREAKEVLSTSWAGALLGRRGASITKEQDARIAALKQEISSLSPNTGAPIGNQGRLSAARSVSIPIANPGFENPSQGNGDYNFSVVSGWTVSGTGGVFRPLKTQLPQGAAQGIQVAWSNDGSFTQTLSAVLMPNTQYILEVDLLNRSDVPNSSSTVELLAGHRVLASSTITGGAPGTSVVQTVSFLSDATDPYLGQQLGIALISGGTQSNWDNVRLHITPATESSGVPAAARRQSADMPKF